jgi:hypothetical protein
MVYIGLCPQDGTMAWRRCPSTFGIPCKMIGCIIIIIETVKGGPEMRHPTTASNQLQHENMAYPPTLVDTTY